MFTLQTIMDSEQLVYFTCVEEKRRLRVRIISPGYNPESNCQFPSAIRTVGGRYSAPVSAIKFARGSAGKFFYRVAAKKVRVVRGNARPNEVNNIGANRDDDLEDLVEQMEGVKITLDQVYGDDEEACIICMDEAHEVVVVPCGHFCMCGGCGNQVKEITGLCPLCRVEIQELVTRDMIQT